MARVADDGDKAAGSDEEDSASSSSKSGGSDEESGDQRMAMAGRRLTQRRRSAAWPHAPLSSLRPVSAGLSSRKRAASCTPGSDQVRMRPLGLACAVRHRFGAKIGPSSAVWHQPLISHRA